MTATTFATLAEPTRLRILDLLRERPRPVGELVEALGLSQPGVSKHLRVLRDARLVDVRPDAQRRIYQVDARLVDVRPDAQRRIYQVRAQPLAEVDAWLAPYRELFAGHLDALERHLDQTKE